MCYRDHNIKFHWNIMEVLMETLDPEQLIHQLTDARARTCALIDQLSGEQLIGPRLATINPLRWEIGHVAYFYEYWVLRQLYQEPPIITDIDQLFDSIHIAHETRWDLDLPSLQDTLKYMRAVKDRVVAHFTNGKHDELRDYLVQYAIFHEDMHCEAFTYTRQTLEYPIPSMVTETSLNDLCEPINGDVDIPAGEFLLGASPSETFMFDNEKWAHQQSVDAFKISRVAVCNQDYASFVNDSGYTRSEYWCEQGWKWRTDKNLQHPIYWRKSNNTLGWQVRWFNHWHDLQPDAAIIHVNWYEANAYCRWANRRLPSELEWEVAASALPSADGKSLANNKRYFPWGSESCQSHRANLDGLTLGPISVYAKSQGDSAFGCRQMLGNVWEWTSTTFAPYPGFTPDMYQDYSQPLFDKTKVLRGGCWATRSRLIRNTWRNYYGADRNDVFAGFRTCAID